MLSICSRAVDMDSLPRLYPRLRRLEPRDHVPVNHNHLTTLASLPTFKHLSILLNPREPLNGPVMLGGLQSIHISTFELPAVGALIAHMDALQLRTFSFSESSMEHDKLTGHLRTLVTKCPSLATFRWSCSCRRGVPNRRQIHEPFAEFIGPLLSLCALRNFTADLTFLFVTYTPSDFVAFAKAWPELETFKFSDKRPEQAEHYADLGTLASFARHCTRLRTLHLPTFKFDAGTNTSIDVAESPPAHWLEELAVEDIIYPRLKSKVKTRRALRLLQDRMRKMFPVATLQCPLWR